MKGKLVKYCIVGELREVREFEKKYLDEPNKIIMDQEVKIKWGTTYLYYRADQGEEAKEFFRRLAKIISEERKRLEEQILGETK